MVKIENKINAIIKKIVYWMFILLLIYLIFELIRKLLGGSLGFEDLVIGLLLANLSYSFYLKGSINKIEAKISEHLGWHKGKNDSS